MKTLSFDRNKATYDLFDRFSIESREGWLQFESGEVCYTSSSPDPEYRRFYPEYDATIFMPGDRHAPDIYDPATDKVIPAAQLSWKGCSPYLIADHGYKKVKCLGSMRSNVQIPYQLRYTSAYWAAADSEPVARPITYYPPNVFTKEKKEFLKTCQGAAAMIMALRSSDPGLSLSVTKNQGVTQTDIQAALDQDIQPMIFLEQFGLRPLGILKASPLEFVLRSPVTIPFAILKEK